MKWRVCRRLAGFRIATGWLLVLALMATACSADPSTIEPTATEGAADGSFSILGQLGEIPLSTPGGSQTGLLVAIADVDAAADQARVRRPADPTDPDQLVDFLFPLTGVSRDERQPRLFVAWPQAWTNQVSVDVDEFVNEIGFVPYDVTTFAVLEAPPALFIVAGGVSANSALPEVLPGVRSAGEGEDFAVDIDDRTTARQLGRPLRIAEQDGKVAMSLATTPVADWLEGDRQSLADGDALPRIARRLDEESVPSALLFSEHAVADTGFGLGWAADDKPRGVIVIAYSSEAEAQAQLAAVTASLHGDSLWTGRPMSEMVTLTSTEVRESEIVVLVTFPEDRNPRVLYEMLLRQDGPFSVQP